MLKTFPSLKDAKIDYAWSGNFALTLTRFPQMGRLGDNLLFSHGCSGHGVTTTHLLGRLLAEAVTGDPTRFNIIANLPYYPFPGGRLFRVPATIAGSWYYRARDARGRTWLFLLTGAYSATRPGLKRADVILRRVDADTFIAFTINCTHLGCPVRWLAEADLFMCPCHGGVYYNDGTVAAGPPPAPLPRYQVRVLNGDVQILTAPIPISNK